MQPAPKYRKSSSSSLAILPEFLPSSPPPPITPGVTARIIDQICLFSDFMQTKSIQDALLWNWSFVISFMFLRLTHPIAYRSLCLLLSGIFFCKYNTVCLHLYSTLVDTVFPGPLLAASSTQVCWKLLPTLYFFPFFPSQPFFSYLLAVWLVSPVKYLFQSFVHFSTRLFIFSYLTCRSSLPIPVMIPWQGQVLQNSPSTLWLAFLLSSLILKLYDNLSVFFMAQRFSVLLKNFPSFVFMKMFFFPTFFTVFPLTFKSI